MLLQENQKSLSFKDHFNNYFSLEIADNPDLLAQVFKIRYQVYCQELKYEPEENFPDGMEKDDYDSHSIHCLLKYQLTGQYIGCVRIVLSKSGQPEKKFPFEKICADNLSMEITHSNRPKFCEVSRLAVISEFRKRKGEFPHTVGLGLKKERIFHEFQERRKFPNMIPSALYLASTSMVLECQLKAFTLMEPRLARHLRGCGLPSDKLGTPVKFHGRRAPFLMDPTIVIDNLVEEQLQLFKQIHPCLSKPVAQRQQQLYSLELGS